MSERGRHVARLPIADKLPLKFTSAFSTQAGAESSVYLKAATIGVVAGMRSTLPFALLNWKKDQSQLPDDASTFQRVMNSPGVQFLASSAFIGELIGDKLPIIPSRTKHGPFIGRLVIGATAGMTICRRSDQSPLVGAALGAVGAAVGTWLGHYSRITLAQSTGVSDTVWGLTEDALALGLGTFAVQK